MLPSPEPIAPDQFGPYEVYERLGLGGMATVHRAKKRGPAGYERSVALKRMLSHLAEDASFVESFIREAKVASILVHPNIAQVYDFGRINGIYYIAMELVPGFDVRRLLRFSNRANESIPLPVVLSILGEMCDALEYAHSYVDEHGQPLRIVHRDISPSNMIMAHSGHLKLIDFGIAKAASRQLHTESGQVKGKLGYMSPEAALGMQIGTVSDVFSMGVVGWELVTSSPLFSSRTDFETMRRIREGEIVPPSTKNPACPPELDRIILGALERDPDRRLASAGSFRRGLDAIAARVGSVGPRGVAEWMRQFIQPDDYVRFSGGQLPQDAQTAVLRPSAKPRLQRTQSEIALATEIWGEDQGATAASAGPDFVVENPRAPTQPPPGTYGGPHPSGPLAALPAVMPLPTGPQQPPGYQSLAAMPMPGTTSIRPSRTGVVLVGGLATVAAVLAVILIVKKPSHDSAPAAPHASVKITVEPGDAKLELAGKPIDKDVEQQLAPGSYEITARRAEYKPATKTLTLADGDAQTLDIALERAIAHVSVDSQPRGLAVTIDGKPAGATPLDLDTATGPHDVVVASGDKQWKQSIVASVATKNAFVATFDIPTPTPAPPQHPQHPTHVAQNNSHNHRPVEHVEQHPPDPTPDIDFVPAKPPVDPPKPPIDPPKPPVTPPTAPARTPVVAATAVQKISGDVPTIRGDQDSDALVKMCIDESGKVTSVKVVKATAEMPPDLTHALQGWRYKPYLNKDQKPTAACFALSLRVVVKRAD